MHAMQLELLAGHLPEEGARILDVGSGSGYIAACFTRMAGPSGKVVGIEHIAALTALSIENVKRDDATLLSSGRLRLVTGAIIALTDWKMCQLFDGSVQLCRLL